MNTHLERKVALEHQPSLMMRVRQRLYPYRRYLKWLRHVARWQMRLKINYEHQWRFCRWVSLLTTDPGEEVFWRMPGTSIKFSLDLKETIQANLYYRGAFQPEIRYWVRQCLRPQRLFIDGGANVGLHCLWAADYYRQHLNTAAQPMVYAFEPNPHIYARLQHNIRLNALETFISAYQLALSDQDGVVNFYLSSQDNSTSSSLAFLGPNHFHTGETIQIRAVTLSNFLDSHANQQRLGLLKLDIEGAELLALRGAYQLLSRDRPTLILEIYPALMEAFGYTFRDVSDFLQALDYEIYLIQPNCSLVVLEDAKWPDDRVYGDIICFPHGGHQ